MRNALRYALPLVATFALGWGLAEWTSAPANVARRTMNRIRGNDDGPGLPGHWGTVQASSLTGHMDPGVQDSTLKDEIKRLQSLGYPGGTILAGTDAGVTAFHPDSASTGLRFFISGHEPGATLIDNQGNALHRWHLTYSDFVAKSAQPADAFLEDTPEVTACWRRAHLMEGGDVLAIFEGHGLARIDANSNLVWAYPGPCHHDLDVAPDGTIHVLTREPRIVPDYHPRKPLLLDFITVLSPDGQEIGSLDILAAFENSRYASLLNRIDDPGDIFHTNTVERLDGSRAHLSPIFGEGNYLISVREIDVIAIIDPTTQQVVWALTGMWQAQHQPTLLENGHILLFDNQGHGGRSKVIEIDPLTQEVAWMYADGDHRSLYSATCGSNQRLDNGNTLITESDNGRALEVTPAGSIVWEFRNPQRTGRDNRYIAAIMEMVALPEGYQPDWLSAGH